MFHTISNSKNKLNYYNYQALFLNSLTDQQKRFYNKRLNNEEFYKFLELQPYPDRQNIVGELLAAKEQFIAVVNAVIFYCVKHKLTYPTHEEIAFHINRIYGWNICRQTVCKLINMAIKLNLIAVHKAAGAKSLIYKISSFFMDNYEQLKSKFWALKLSIKPLSLESLKSGLATQCNIVFNFIYKKAKQPNTNKQPLRKEESQRKAFKKKGSMFEAQVEVRDLIRNLGIKFTVEQQQLLTQYSDTQLLAAKHIIEKRKNVKTPAVLFLWLLRNEPTVIHAKSAYKPAVIKPNAVKAEIKKVEEKKYTTIQMANEIANILQMPNNAPMLISKDMHERIKEKTIHNLLWDRQAILTQEPEEEIALMFINSWREKLFPPVVEEPKKDKVTTNPTQIANMISNIMGQFKPELNLTNEIIVDNTNTQKDKKISTTVKFDVDFNPDEYEEVYE